MYIQTFSEVNKMSLGVVYFRVHISLHVWCLFIWYGGGSLSKNWSVFYIPSDAQFSATSLVILFNKYVFTAINWVYVGRVMLILVWWVCQ